MQNRGEFADFEPRIRLEIGNVYELEGSPELAIDTYTKLAGDFPDSIASREAWYKIGTLLLHDMANARDAQDAFQRVYQGRVPTGQSWAVESQIKAVQIDSLFSKRQQIERLGGKRDSQLIPDIPDSQRVATPGTQVVPNSPADLPPNLRGQPQVADTVSVSRADTSRSVTPQPAAPVPDRFTRLAEARFLLAELYFFSFNRPDLAKEQYTLITEESPDSDFAVRSRYFLAIQTLSKDDPDYSAREREIIQEFIAQYPESAFVQDLKVFLGIIKKTPDEESFIAAELARMLRNDPDEFIPLYQKVADDYPLSKNAYRARYLIAYSCEHDLGDAEKAKSLYQALSKETPTPASEAYVNLAKDRLLMMEQEDELMKKIANNIAYYESRIRDLKAGRTSSGVNGSGQVSAETGIGPGGGELTGMKKIRERNERIRSRYFPE